MWLMVWLHLAMLAISSCSALAGRGGLGTNRSSSSDLLRWARCGHAIVRCGQAQLQDWVDAAEGRSQGAHRGEDTTALAKGAYGHANNQMTAMWSLLRLLPESEHAKQAFTAGMGSEDDFLTWLATAATIVNTAERAGCLPDHGLPFFANLAVRVLLSPAFARHQAALADALQHQIQVAALLPALCRAAALVVDGSHSRDGSSTSGSASAASGMLVPSTLNLLNFGCLRQGLWAQLQGSHGAEMLAAVATLITSISRQPPTATATTATAARDHAQLLASAMGAWGIICTVTRLQVTHNAMVQPEHRLVAQQAALLLPALARMAGQLQPVDIQSHMGPASLMTLPRRSW